MSPTTVGNLYLLMSVFTTSIAQVVIKRVSLSIPSESTAAGALRLVLTTPIFWPALFALLLSASGFAFWLLSVQRLPLSYAYPLACSSAFVVAALSAVFLGESITWRVMLGTSLIALGAALVLAQPQSVR